MVSFLVTLPLVFPPIALGFLLLLVFGYNGPGGWLLRETAGIRLVFTTAGVTLAAYLAGLGTGFWKDTARLCDLRSSDTVYVPGMEDARHAKLLEGWAEAVKRTMAR